jgi:hypothetical protein
MLMAKKTRSSRKGSKVSRPVEWSEPDVIWFAGDQKLPVGAIRQDSLSDIAGYLFGKKREHVETEWKKVVDQISTLIDAAKPVVEDYSLDEITFQLGFSAEGHIVFVAKAGVQTTISAKFKRKY